MEINDEEETLIECRACAGHWKIPDRAGGKPHVCRWCTEGMMTGKQLAHWLAHKSGPRRIL